MITKELKTEIQDMLNRNIGIMMYAVIKIEEGKVVKFVNIADELHQEDKDRFFCCFYCKRKVDGIK